MLDEKIYNTIPKNYPDKEELRQKYIIQINNKKQS